MPKPENPYHAIAIGHLQNIYHNQLVLPTIVCCTTSFHLGPTLNLSRRDTKKEPVLTDSKAHDFLAKSVRDHYFYHFRETSLRDTFMYDIYFYDTFYTSHILRIVPHLRFLPIKTTWWPVGLKEGSRSPSCFFSEVEDDNSKLVLYSFVTNVA